VRCPKEERDELVLAEPGPHPGELRLVVGDPELPRLDALEDEGELRDILADSWRQAAPTRLLEAHPRLGLPAGE
jgi:hypothetical protein